MSDTTTHSTQPNQIKCDCWEKMEKLEAEHGLKMDPRCSGLTMATTGEGETFRMSLRVRRGIPLVRIDGKRPKRRDPIFVVMRHCPFCGIKLL